MYVPFDRLVYESTFFSLPTVRDLSSSRMVAGAVLNKIGVVLEI
jgi:hypothetical protein